MQISPTTKTGRLAQPTDPYDTPAWMAFYADNPGFRRSVGAEGVNDDDDNSGDDDDDIKGKSKDSNSGADGDDDKDKSKKDGPSDKEAELLKDLMKQKEARKSAEGRLADLEKKLSSIDLDEYSDLKSQKEEAAQKEKEAEEQRLLDKGEFEKVKDQMIEQHNKTIEGLNAEIEGLKGTLSKSNKVIEELTVGSNFSNSDFIKEDTIFTPNKARALYGAHFEIEEGKVVAYDKPRGESDRAPIVNERGDPANFDVAMKRIIEMDPDRDHVLRSKIKPGSNSEPGDGKSKKQEAPLSSQDKISKGLTDLMKNIDQQSDSGIKL